MFKDSTGQKKVQSIGKQITAWTTGPLAIILAVLVVLMMMGIQEVLSDLKLREINDQTAVSMQIVEGFFEPYYMSNGLISNTDKIKDGLKEAMKQGEDLRFESYSQYQEMLHLLKTVHDALGDSVQSVWLTGFGNSQMMASTGFTTERGLDITARPWYDQLINSEDGIVVSAAYEDYESGQIVVSVIQAIYDGSKIIGAAGIDVVLDGLVDQMDKISIGETGTVILCDRDGNVVYAKDKSLMMKNLANHNYADSMKEALKKTENTLAEEKHVEEGDSGRSAGYYSAIIYSDDLEWRLIGSMPNYEFTQEAWDLGVPLFWAAIICVLLIFATCMIAGRMLARPVKELSEVTSKLAAGELDTEVNIKSNSEIRLLVDNIGQLVERLKTYILYIDEASTELGKMGNGDLRINLEQAYDGEFIKLKESILSVRKSLTHTISEINQAASQVDSGTVQISSAAQSLAQGTTEQASAVEQLASSVNMISEQSSDGARVAEELKENFENVNKKLSVSNVQTKQLLDAMDDISDKSEKISEIIKTISDIAFQTNILALNAAVEAARAGQAGKGFSVVADEVRNLASKCNEAANNITGLIKDSTEAVGNGVMLAKNTAGAINDVASTMDNATHAMDELADRYREEATALNQVATGIDQISSVVQNNSATAEETAAGSQELAAQAKTLFGLTAKFKM